MFWFRMIAASTVLGVLSLAAAPIWAADDGKIDKILDGAARAVAAQDYASAQQGIEKAVQLDPDNPKVYFVLGLLLDAQGDDAAARQAYEAYLQLSRDQLPTDPEVLVNLRRHGLY